MAELERMNDLFVGREFRIKGLRDRVKELEESKPGLPSFSFFAVLFGEGFLDDRF